MVYSALSKLKVENTLNTFETVNILLDDIIAPANTWLVFGSVTAQVPQNHHRRIQVINWLKNPYVWYIFKIVSIQEDRALYLPSGQVLKTNTEGEEKNGMNINW